MILFSIAEPRTMAAEAVSSGQGAARPQLKVLIVLDYYLPGEKGGGPVLGAANMVERLGDRFAFLVVARDRDLRDTAPYPGIQRDAWNSVGKARVFYASKLSVRTLLRVIRECAPDVLYVNSFFSRASMKVLFLRQILRGHRIPVVLAPHGEFSRGALQLKAARKRAYLSLARTFPLFRDILWQAISALEVGHIRQTMGRHCNVHVAPYLPVPKSMADPASGQRPQKVPGRARLVFVSRISPKKNLLGALEILESVDGEVSFDIFGPIEDEPYWKECLRVMDRLPSRIMVTYRGVLAHESVLRQISQYHFFLLPTLGENFGGSILEAMLAGCPVLISDRTPWVNLPTRRIGWDLPLEDSHSWREALREAVEMDGETYQSFSNAARKFALEWSSSPNLERQTIELFTTAARPV